MKRNKLSYLATLFAAIVLSSCSGLNKMKDKASGVNYSANPQVLESKGGEVEVTISGKYPAKYFNKKAALELTPVLKSGSGETSFKSYKVQGESVQGNDKVIKYTEGGEFTYTDKVPYKPEMRVSTLEVRAKGSLKKASVDFPAIKIGDGVIATEFLVVKDARPIAMADKFQRVIPESYEADIKFLINKADVRSTEVKKDELKNFNSSFVEVKKDSTKEIKDLTISAYASPDGELDFNAKLAEKRKESADKYFASELKKAKLNKEVDENIFKYLTTAEDWEGFKNLLEKSDVRDKELILRVLSMYSDPVVREREIKNISAAFEEIKDKILPELRRSKFILNFDNIGKSDAELTSIASSSPENLNIEEMLYAATLTQDMNQKLNVYQAAAKKYPDDIRARNNVGYALLNLNRVDEAQTALTAARQINDNDIVKNNLGVVAMKKGDLKAAEELFTSAMGAGETVSYNLGIIKIIQGKYADAINYFGNTNEINAALAKLLAKQNDAALATLNNIKSEDALVYYLRAIIGARTNNTDMLYNNLRIASGKSAELKANAKTDMEFGKYFNEDAFKSIVQ
jgi:tetratricopeptide (TPR) repeat protein